MRQIEFFGRFWTVKFDTDKPLDVKEIEKLNRTQLKALPRRGMSCTLTSNDGEVVVARSECSRKDVFSRETGEATSLRKALDMIASKIVKIQVRNAFTQLKAPVAPKAVTPAPAPVAAPKAVASVTSAPVAKKSVRKADTSRSKAK